MGIHRMTMRRLQVVGLFVALVAGAHIAAANGNAPSQSPSRGAVIFFGDSLTAGYGLEDPEQAYPSLIRERIDAAHLPFEVVNAGVSGETTAGGVRRVGWVLKRPVAVFVLALGGNDGLRGVPVEETEKNLQAIIDAVHKQQPATRIILAGMQTLPNMGANFSAKFREIFPRIAAANKLPLVPFLLEGVGGVAELNARDGIHPNPRGQVIVADNVWRVLEPMLRELVQS